MAGSTLMLLPVLVVFFVAQRYFIRGIVTSGLGGR
jgi:ABC-type glycerol-3-phosphate transport system permease component